MTKKEIRNYIDELIATTDWGSIEIIVQSGKVTQVTQRKIQKIKEEEKPL